MFQRRRLRFTLSALCLGMILVHLAIFWKVRSQAAAGMPDFRIFYTAGLMLRQGQGRSLYDDALQLTTQRAFAPQATSDHGLLPYNHPPFEAILYVPLTYLTFLRAYALSLLLNGLLLALSLDVIRPWIPATVANFPELLFLAPLGFYPAFLTLMEGQDSILLLALYCLAYAAFRRGHDFEAGVWLGLGLFKFHLVLPFAVVLLLCRRWRAIAGILMTACCELLISCVMVGWKELLYYPRYVWHVNRGQAEGVIVPGNMPNLRGLLTDWAQSPAMRWRLELLLAVLSFCLLVWAANQWGDWDLTHSYRWTAGFSIAVVTTFLVGYHGYNHDLSIALLPILITFNHLVPSNGSVPHAALPITLGLLFLSPIYLLLTLLFNQQHFFALVLLAFVFCLAASSSKQRRTRVEKLAMTSEA